MRHSVLPMVAVHNPWLSMALSRVDDVGRLEGAGHCGTNLGAAGVVKGGERLVEALHRRRNGGDDARLCLAAKAVLQPLTGYVSYRAHILMLQLTRFDQALKDDMRRPRHESMPFKQ